MVGMVLAYIFYAKVINYKGKQDRLTFVVPQTRGLGALVIFVFEKVFLQ